MLTAGAFLAAYAAGCLLALFRHPIFGLVTYVGVFYLHPPVRWWGGLLPDMRWSLLAACVTLVSLMIHSPDKKGPRLFDHGLMTGALLFLAWIGLQTLWALDRPTHIELVTLTAKYVLLLVLIYKCVDSELHLRYFLWAHAAGCFYFGMIVFSSYIGGRFEGFGAPGVDEANSGSLQIVTGVIVTFVLFLSGKWIQKAVAVVFMPFTLNALVATISRSGFLALGISGLLFNLFTPLKYRKLVRVLSIAGLVLFLSLTNANYWDRIDTLLVAGEKIEGEDTGFGRVVLMQAQLQMFAEHPLGCGHRCTAVLSPEYLEDRFLTGTGEQRARSSHNTFLSLLVEQGIPGGIFYCLLLFWVARLLLKMRGPMRAKSGFTANVYTGLVAILGAIFVGDMFVDYLKYETRVWFLGILMVLYRLHCTEQACEAASGKERAGAARLTLWERAAAPANTRRVRATEPPLEQHREDRRTE